MNHGVAATDHGLIRPEYSRDQAHRHRGNRATVRVLHHPNFQPFNGYPDKLVLVEPVVDGFAMSEIRKIEPFEILNAICNSTKSVAYAGPLMPHELSEFVACSHVIHEYRQPYEEDRGGKQKIDKLPLGLSEKKRNDSHSPDRTGSKKAALNQRHKGKQRQQSHCAPEFEPISALDRYPKSDTEANYD